MTDFTRPPAAEDLCRLAARRAVYRPTHAAADLGISYDSVNRFLNQRPRSFPPGEPGFVTRTEWSSFENYLRVLWVLCSLSPYICRRAHHRIGLLATKNEREKSGKSAIKPSGVAAAF